MNETRVFTKDIVKAPNLAGGGYYLWDKIRY